MPSPRSRGKDPQPPPSGGSLKNARILRVHDDGGVDACEEMDLVAVEAPLEILLAYPQERTGTLLETSISLTMRTPGNDEALAVGFLFCEGFLSDPREIHSIHSEESRISVRLRRTPSILPGMRKRHFASTGSCGVCGKEGLDALASVPTPIFHPTRPSVSAAVLRQMPQCLFNRQSGFSQTGGMHGAARYTVEGELLTCFEDIGRHNALDKLIGDALLRGALPASEEVLLLSGRVGYELSQKSLAAGFPIVAAIGAPSSLAVEMSNTSRQTLVGFLRRDRHNLYSHPQRILSD